MSPSFKFHSAWCRWHASLRRFSLKFKDRLSFTRSLHYYVPNPLVLHYLGPHGRCRRPGHYTPHLAVWATYLSPSLVSLSIEQDRWVDWAGASVKNSFIHNTLDNLKQLTGEPPWIRIGADSEDHTNFNPNTRCVCALGLHM